MINQEEHKKFGWKRLIFWFFIALIAVIIGLASLVLLSAERYINDNLSNFVYEKSNNTYRFNFDNLDIDFAKRTISIQNISLHPDSVFLTDSSRNMYHFNTHQLTFSKIDLGALLINRRFNAKSLKIEKPDLKLHTGIGINLEQLSKNQILKDDTLHLPYFAEIFFDSVLVIDARLNVDSLFKTSKEIPKINIVANHFKIGGRKFTDTPFPFDVSDIALVIENLHETLPDGIHEITVKKINLSIMSSVVTAIDVFLSPLNDSLIAENRYSLSMPKITLKTSQIDQLVHTDTIMIESMEVLNPTIEIKFGTKVNKGTPLNEINLFKLLDNRLKWINIDLFSIKNSDVKLIPSNADEFAQHFENLNIDFFNFFSDSVSYKNPERIFSATDFQIEMSKLTLNHTDDVHQLIINNIKANSQQNLVGTGMISFLPLKNSNQSKLNTIISAHCDEVYFKGVDFHEMYHNQIVPMTELIIKKPVTEIGFQRKYIDNQKSKDKSLILEKTEDYIKGIYVDKTLITDGSMRYNYITEDKKQGFFHTLYSFELSQLSVDSVTFYQTDKIFFADNFELNFYDVGLQMADETHRMEADSLNLSSQGRSAEIFDLKISPTSEGKKTTGDEEYEMLNIHFPRIQLSGANLHRAFFYKELYISNFNIYNPTFNIEKKGEWASEKETLQGEEQDYKNDIYVLVADYMNSINIKNLNMTNGTLNLVQHKIDQSDFSLSNTFSIKMRNFDINANSSKQDNKLFFSDDIDLVLTNHSFTLADDVHRIDAKEIGILSSEKRLYIKGAKLYPLILSKAFEEMPVSVFATIPEIQITNADIFGLFNKGHLPVDQVNIIRPDIRLLFQKAKSKTKTTEKQQPILLLKDLKSITAKRIIIDKGRLELANYEDYTSKIFVNTELEFSLDQFRITQSNGKFKTTYHDFVIDLNNTAFDLPDQVHAVKSKNIHYQLASKELNIKNISLLPKKSINQSDKIQTFEIKIPEVKLNGFNLESYFEHEVIESSLLHIEKPTIVVTDNRIERKVDFSPYQLNLYPALAPYAKKVSIDHISINDAALDRKQANSLKLDHVNLTALQFIVDENNTNKGKLFNAEHVDLLIRNISGKTDKDYFQYTFDEIKLNDKGDFEINGVTYLPLISEKEFARKMMYQTDYFKIDEANITGNGLDVKQFIENKNLYINNLNVNFNNIHIHRDKTYPLHPTAQPKMPQQAIREIKQQVNIMNSALSFKKFEYTELVPDAMGKLYVFFTDGKATLSNLTNISSILSVNPIMKTGIEAYLMGVGKTNIEIAWDVRSFGNEFSFNGICQQMPLNILNPVTEPSLKLSIREGFSQKLEVNFEANGDSAIGNMRFAYNDLKIYFLSEKDGELKEEKFISFLINSMALKSDNPKPGRIMMPARFKNHRDKQRSVVSYCWKSVYFGIKSTFGIKDKEEPK